MSNDDAYNTMRHKLARIVSTSFGAGYWPWGPGTAGAVFGVMLWLPLWWFCSGLWLFGITAALVMAFTALGVWSASEMEREWGPDPSKVVMDETVGVWIALLPVGPRGVDDGQWWWIPAALVLFRIFDIWKPLGIRRLERLRGGLGVMADDIAAGTLGALLIVIGQIVWNIYRSEAIRPALLY